MTHDPTIDEMREYLDGLPFANEFDEFDREEAIYWFANGRVDQFATRKAARWNEAERDPFSGDAT